MGQDGKIGKSEGRLTEAEFRQEVTEDHSREKRLSWGQLFIVLLIVAFAVFRQWINS